jgi:hypothetical protein
MFLWFILLLLYSLSQCVIAVYSSIYLPMDIGVVGSLGLLRVKLLGSLF